MREAIKNMAMQTIAGVPKLGTHPIAGPLSLLFDIKVEMGAYHKLVRANGARLKAQVNKYLQNRKSGTQKSKMQGFDMMQLFIDASDMFTDENIVENLIGTIFAATETTQFASQTAISHLA